MTDFSVNLSVEDAERLVGKVSDLVGPALISIQTHVTISTDNEKAARMLAILFEQAPNVPEKKPKAKKTAQKPATPAPEAAEVAPAAQEQPKPEGVIYSGNGDPGINICWELLGDDRKAKDSFTNETKTARLASGYFYPGDLLRYKKNGTVRKVVGASGQPQKLEPLNKGA